MKNHTPGSTWNKSLFGSFDQRVRVVAPRPMLQMPWPPLRAPTSHAFDRMAPQRRSEFKFTTKWRVDADGDDEEDALQLRQSPPCGGLWGRWRADSSIEFSNVREALSPFRNTYKNCFEEVCFWYEQTLLKLCCSPRPCTCIGEFIGVSRRDVLLNKARWIFSSLICLSHINIILPYLILTYLALCTTWKHSHASDNNVRAYHRLWSMLVAAFIRVLTIG